MEFPPLEASVQFMKHGIKLVNDFIATSHVSLARHPYLYHYRQDKAVVESIVTNGKFWATHAAHMSDETELEYGAMMVKSILDEFVSLNKEMSWDVSEFIEMAWLHANPYNNEFTGKVDPYFVCFSERGDIESQWEEYAAESTGYCIEFTVAEPYTNPCSENSYDLARSNILFLKVIYDVDEQRRLVINALQDFVRMLHSHLEKYGFGAMGSGMHASIALYHVLCYYVMSFKDPKFIKEQEWRCVYGMSNMKVRNLEVKYRGEKVPYVEMPLVSLTGPLVVKNIVQGVACTQGEICKDYVVSKVVDGKT